MRTMSTLLLAAMLALPMMTPYAWGDDDYPSTSSTTSSSRTLVLRTRTTLLANNAAVKICRFAASADSIIFAWYTDNTPTTGGQAVFSLDMPLTLNGSVISVPSALYPSITVGTNIEEIRDMFRLLSQKGGGEFRPIPVKAGQVFVQVYETSATNDVIIDVILGIQGNGTLTCKPL